MIAVLDIDGVLADSRHREHLIAHQPRDWDAFFALVGDDPVIPDGLELLRALESSHTVVLLSGRPERTRVDTREWLGRQGIEVRELVLRADADHRPAPVVKGELIATIGSPHEVALVVDDDARVVEHLGRLGYPTRHFERPAALG